MAKPKYDGVVEAVHYQSNGRVEWVMAYQRRGATFSDHLMLSRQTLIDHLSAGKRYVVGRRLLYLGGTFEVSKPLRLLQKDGHKILVVGDLQVDQDRLEGVPVI